MLKQIGDAASITFDKFNEIVSPKIVSRDPQEELNKLFNLFDEDCMVWFRFKIWKPYQQR